MNSPEILDQVDEQTQQAILAEIINHFGFLVLASYKRAPIGYVIPAGGWSAGQGSTPVQQPAVIVREATAEEWRAQFDWATTRWPGRKALPLRGDPFYYAVTFD